jgi:hypothetical protein
VWKTFLERADAAPNISGKDIERLLEHLLNGRQAKQCSRESFKASTNILY